MGAAAFAIRLDQPELAHGRSDCERLLREMNTSEGVHWLTIAICVSLVIGYLLDDAPVYGCAMLLVRIPFDLYPILLQRWNRGRVCRGLRATFVSAPPP